jgi:hypothetical protein
MHLFFNELYIYMILSLVVLHTHMQTYTYTNINNILVSRLVLSKGRYRMLKTPMNYINSVKPCQGRVKKIKTALLAPGRPIQTLASDGSVAVGS